MNTQQVTVKDVNIDTGQGGLVARSWTPQDQKDHAPLVLFHDSLGCIDLWRDFPQRLAQESNRTVVAYDRLGFGRSQERNDVVTPAFVHEEAETFVPLVLEGLGLERFVAMGHSVGGGMAIETAALYSDQCEGLITIAAQSFAEDRTLSGIRDAKELFADPQQLERLKRYHGEKARWVVDAWVETWLSDAFAQWSLKTVLPQVKCRSLIIHGNEDEYGSTAHAKMISGGVCGPSELEILSGFKHVPHRENEELVIGLILSFLNGL